MLHNSAFISDPGPGWAAPTTIPAPAPAAAPPAPPLARVFAGWEDMTPRGRSRAIRNAGVLAARAAGLSRAEIAPAAGLVRSQVTAIVRSHATPS